MLVDSHVNLHGAPYEDDLAEVLTRAEGAGVGAMLAISDRLSSEEAIAAIVARRQNLWRTIGVHPHHAKDHADLKADRLLASAKDEKVVAIGECGLDRHYEYSDFTVQQRVLAAHVEAAEAAGLPLVLHTREADEAMIEVLSGMGSASAATPLLHCYTGGMALAEAALERGGYVSFSGIVSFKKAEAVRAVAREVPLDRILVETDCPYLAPVPMRGRRNEPAYLPHVIAALAEARGEDPDVLAEATTENFFRLFAKARRPS